MVLLVLLNLSYESANFTKSGDKFIKINYDRNDAKAK